MYVKNIKYISSIKNKISSAKNKFLISYGFHTESQKVL